MPTPAPASRLWLLGAPRIGEHPQLRGIPEHQRLDPLLQAPAEDVGERRRAYLHLEVVGVVAEAFAIEIAAHRVHAARAELLRRDQRLGGDLPARAEREGPVVEEALVGMRQIEEVPRRERLEKTRQAHGVLEPEHDDLVVAVDGRARVDAAAVDLEVLGRGCRRLCRRS